MHVSEIVVSLYMYLHVNNCEYMWLFFQNVLHVLCTDGLQFNVYHRVVKKAICTKIVYSYMQILITSLTQGVIENV